MRQQANVTYSLDDVGCYVDGSRGIYAIDRIVEIAETHGMTPPICEASDDDVHDIENESCTWAYCSYSDEIEYEGDNYMNDHHGAEGA